MKVSQPKMSRDIPLVVPLYLRGEIKHPDVLRRHAGVTAGEWNDPAVIRSAWSAPSKVNPVARSWQPLEQVAVLSLPVLMAGALGAKLAGCEGVEPPWDFWSPSGFRPEALTDSSQHPRNYPIQNTISTVAMT